jgi:hypothetical protein
MSSSSSSDSEVSNKSDHEEVVSNRSDHEENEATLERNERAGSSPPEQNEEVASNRSERGDDDAASSQSEKEGGEEVAHELILSDSDEEGEYFLSNSYLKFCF